MRFALVTDVHFGPIAYFQGKLRKLSHRAAPLLEGVLAALRNEDLDLLINLGDVIEDESVELDRERYGEFLAVMATSPAPVLHVAGNHDLIHLSEAWLGESWGRSGPLYYSQDVAGVHFAVLCTLETKDVAVHLPDEQLAWLERDLAATRLPAIVLMHHPAGDMPLTGNRWFEKAPHICRVAERRALRALIERAGNVVAVFNGHAHWNHVDVHRGIPYVTLQSLIENLDDDAPGRPARAFAVCELDEHALTVRIEGAERYRWRFERQR